LAITNQSYLLTALHFRLQKRQIWLHACIIFYLPLLKLNNINMKIIVTGSLGNISKPLVQELVQKGQSVTVISSKSDKQKDIEALEATAAIGTIEDVQFLSKTFAGADAVYTMLPPPDFANPNLNFEARVEKIGNNYVRAILAANVKHVVHLSSVGAHMAEGNGLLRWAYNMEHILSKSLPDVAITFLRPVGFYYNLLGFANGIKTGGVIASNYGAEDVIPWVSPIDIATAAAEELMKVSAGNNIRYVASDVLSCNETAAILGAAIGKPDLQWIVISDEQLLQGMKAFGLNDALAEGFVEMNAAMHDGTLFEDYYDNKPVLGKVKLTDYAPAFTVAYNQQ
jgi:uncharacterized protein YbjT (DUF2867 family)